jgi:hypothetical protein
MKALCAGHELNSGELSQVIEHFPDKCILVVDSFTLVLV